MPNSPPPDYFRTLDDFRSYGSTPQLKNPFDPPQIPFVPSPSSSSQKVLVCHDYKGGYCEDLKSRGYSFNWWHLTDTFIYFAHHRISIPPPDWIRAGHRQGTKMLGTLIFEDNNNPLSKDSILSCILGPRLESFDPTQDNFGSMLSAIDTTLADKLVDLAIERGFEGYLINVEVELGIKKDGKWIAGRECGALLKLWIDYLTSETERRIVGGEINWYDGVTIEGSSHRWQNRLSPHNEPFFQSSSSIFLNYFWSTSHLDDSITSIDKLEGRERNQVYVGLDVYGRGQFGGGGFDSFRALNCIQEASERMPKSLTLSNPPALSTGATTSQLSIALFAQGWTVEHFDANLKTKEGYQTWWEDECYLWNGGLETENVKKEHVERDKKRKEERGILRARELARGILGNFNYNADLPTLPPFRSIASYITAPRVPPSPYSTFYTNFSNGSGHSFWFEGEKVLDTVDGWTKIDFSYPPPSLFYHSPTKDVEIKVEEEDAWMGGKSLSIQAKTEGKVVSIPLCPTSLHVSSNPPIGIISYKVIIIWKALEEGSIVGIHPGGGNDSLVLEDSIILPLKSGWFSTSACISSIDDAEISSIGITLSSSSSITSSILLGSISISPWYNFLLPQPLISNIYYSSAPSTSNHISWSYVHSPPPTHSSSLSAPLITRIASPSRLAPWPAFEFCLVFESSEKGRGKCLGFTTARELYWNKEGGMRAVEGKVIILGVKRDGETGEKSF